MVLVSRRIGLALVQSSLLACVLASCAAPERSPTLPDSAPPATALDAADSGSATHQPQPAAEFCAQPTPTGATPHSVADVLQLLNAAPKPVSLPCFLASLARPLALYATDSVISAQPAVGRRSPRTFLFFDGLIASVVADGVGSHLLELGELRPDARSLKAELEFPITQTLADDAPFERIMFDEQRTSCSFCHAAEAHDETSAVAHAFSSQSLRPEPRERVAIAELQAEVTACQAGEEPERCALLRSLFYAGTPVDHEFPAAFKTIVP